PAPRRLQLTGCSAHSSTAKPDALSGPPIPRASSVNRRIKRQLSTTRRTFPVSNSEVNNPNKLDQTLLPDYVIHMVHGTFASRAKWITDDSCFSKHLKASLGGLVKIEPFRWTGGNSVGARWRGAEDLKFKLQDCLATIPHAHHVVVAHSHGANVAL